MLGSVSIPYCPMMIIPSDQFTGSSRCLLTCLNQLVTRFLRILKNCIAGVPGIGDVHGVQLITEFGSLEELLSNVDKVQQGHIREVFPTL